MESSREPSLATTDMDLGNASLIYIEVLYYVCQRKEKNPSVSKMYVKKPTYIAQKKMLKSVIRALSLPREKYKEQTAYC